MNALKDVFKPTTSKSTSSKTPAFYNAEKTRFIVDASINDESKVRMFAATNIHTPTKVLVGMLETEKEKHVLRAVLFNDNLPRKAVAKFVNDTNDERVEWFEEDVELIERYQK